MICWCFQAVAARSVAWPDRSTARRPAQRRARARPRSVDWFGLDARVAAQSVVRELEVVALADQHAQRPVAVTRRLRRGRETAGEQLGRRGQFVRVVLAGERLGDEIAINAEREELALDPIGTPVVQAPAVLCEAPR